MHMVICGAAEHFIQHWCESDCVVFSAGCAVRKQRLQLTTGLEAKASQLHSPSPSSSHVLVSRIDDGSTHE